MEFYVQDLLGLKEVEYYLEGEVLYYLNDSTKPSFFYDSNCKIRSEKDFDLYLKMTNFFLSCFNIDSVNPRDIIFKIRINLDLNLIQFEKAFSKKKVFFTDKICRNYLKNLTDFRYGDVTFVSVYQKVAFLEEDFLEEQVKTSVPKDFLKLTLVDKVCKDKPYLSNEDVSFFKFCLEGRGFHI